MSGLGYRICPVTPFVQNCSLIWCEKTRQAAFVDPGGKWIVYWEFWKKLILHWRRSS